MITQTGSPVSVGTTPTALFAAPDGRRTFTIQNLDSSKSIYLGTISVTTSAYAYRLDPGASFVIEVDVGDVLFGCVASTTASAAVLGVGNP